MKKLACCFLGVFVICFVGLGAVAVQAGIDPVMILQTDDEEDSGEDECPCGSDEEGCLPCPEEEDEDGSL